MDISKTFLPQSKPHDLNFFFEQISCSFNPPNDATPNNALLFSPFHPAPGMACKVNFYITSSTKFPSRQSQNKTCNSVY